MTGARTAPTTAADGEHSCPEADALREELQALVYAVSHDLREPIRMVRSYVGLIERRLTPAPDPDIQDFMDFASDGAKRLEQMIEGLLAFSRVVTHGEPFVAFDLDAECPAAWDAVLAAAGPDAADTTEILWPPMGTMRADPAQMRTLLRQVLGNAVRFRSTERPLTIGVEGTHEGGSVVLKIHDNGSGFAEDAGERAFGYFQRLHAREDRPEGVGMGLPLARRIAERHGGCILMHGAPDKGATVTIRLPLAATEP